MIESKGIKPYQELSTSITRSRVTKKKRYYTANEVAAALGLSKQTLLRYEQKGVFPKANRNQVNRWREYTEKDIDTLRKIIGR